VFDRQNKGDGFSSERMRAMKSVGLMTAAVCLGVAVLVGAQEASALNVQDIHVFEGTFLANGVAQNYFWRASVGGTGLVNCTVTPNYATGTNVALSYTAANDSWDVVQTYATLGDLLTAHPNPCNNRFFFNQKPGGSYADNVLLGYNVNSVGGFVHITYPPNGATNVPLNPTCTWDNVMGVGQRLGLWVNPGFNNVLENPATVALYEDWFDNNMAKMSWLPGVLAPGTKYEFEAAVFNLDGATNPLKTVAGDSFNYFGMRGTDNHVDFTTVPEPMSAMLVGTAALVFIGWRRRRRMS
jgi:hypothetical protein